VSSPASRLRILVVDDYPDAALASCELLELLGHEARYALDGRSALEVMASDFHPDVVILDIGLPDISGLELAPRVRALAGDRPIVIAALTGWGQPADRERSAAAGFDRHFVKPTNLATIREIIAIATARAA
jgi:CheY-like chemotaxis protein